MTTTTKGGYKMAAVISAASNEIKSKIDKQDLLIDLKVLMKEFYVATFTDNGQSLVISFDNGQKFALEIQEIS